MLVKFFTIMEYMFKLGENKKKPQAIMQWFEKIICVWNNINFKMNLEM